MKTKLSIADRINNLWNYTTTNTTLLDNFDLMNCVTENHNTVCEYCSSLKKINSECKGCGAR